MAPHDSFASSGPDRRAQDAHMLVFCRMCQPKVRFVPLLLIPAVFCLLDLYAGDKWISLQSPHFQAVSNAGERRSKRVLSELEEFREVMVRIFELKKLERAPVIVIIFKNDKSFTPFKPLYQGKPVKLAGFFRGGRERNYIALNVNSGNPLNLIYHEYVHLITAESSYTLPVWLNEGLAEFYSTFKLISKQRRSWAPLHDIISSF